MAARKRGLGRGLEALLQSTRIEAEGNDADNVTAWPGEISGHLPDGTLRNLPVAEIVPSPYQPRRHFDQSALEELANSIRIQGVVQPLVVRAIDEGYQLIAGERRWRAAQMAGLEMVPAVIRRVSDQIALAIALIENIQRQDLNPLEEALALKRLIAEFSLTHQQAADAVGRSRAAVSNLLRLLDLDEHVQQRLRDGDLEMGHARALLPLETTIQRTTADTICERALSVRETETLVRQLLAPSRAAEGKAPKAPSPDILNLQTQLSEQLGARVQLQHNARGKGRMVIHYNTLDELDGILSHLQT